jgi:hypothetical protein
MKKFQSHTRRASAIGLAAALIAGSVAAGEIQSINTAANFGPQAGTVRPIYDRLYTDPGAVSYGEIGWDAVKAVDPGITVYNNTPIFSSSPSTKQIIADCVMAPRTDALTIGGDKQCNDTFQTHKRYKMNATSFGPIDMVFSAKNVDAVATIVDKNGVALPVQADQDTARNVYRMIGKLNNHTGKRMSGFKVELGHGIGGSFVPAPATSNLRIALREEGATAGDLGPNDMAEFPGGLFYGPADDKHYWGFFSSERAGFTVEQTALTAGTVTFGSETLNGAYEGLFGKWLPINWVPTGVFFDHDGNPASDALVTAWSDGTLWTKYLIDDANGTRTTQLLTQVDVDGLLAQPATIWNDDGDAPKIADTDPVQTLGGTLYATWDPQQELYVMADGSGTKTNDEMAALLDASTTLERRPGYLQGPIEDLANLNLNYFIEVGDISNFPGYDAMADVGEFTLRITPLEAVGDAGVAPPWAPVVPVTPPVVSTDGGGGCTTANGKAPFDPVLPLLAALGLAGWALRRRVTRSQ